MAQQVDAEDAALLAEFPLDGQAVLDEAQGTGRRSYCNWFKDLDRQIIDIQKAAGSQPLAFDVYESQTFSQLAGKFGESQDFATWGRFAVLTRAAVCSEAEAASRGS